MRERASSDAVSNPQPAPEGEKARIRRGLAHRLYLALLSGGSSLLLIVAMLVLIGVFWALLWDTAFMSVDNFMNILKAKTPLIVMAVATVFVISADFERLRGINEIRLLFCRDFGSTADHIDIERVQARFCDSRERGLGPGGRRGQATRRRDKSIIFERNGPRLPSSTL